MCVRVYVRVCVYVYVCMCVRVYVCVCVCVVKDGWTAVHFSVMRGHCDVMMYLVARGASVTHSNIVSQLNILFISVILFPFIASVVIKSRFRLVYAFYDLMRYMNVM